MHLRYLGFSGFEIISADNFRIVIDPFLVGSEEHGVPPSPVALAELDQTDLVLVSHGAFDHLGQAIDIVKRSGALLGCGPDIRLHARKQGVPDEQIPYLLSGCTLKTGAISVKALDVRHISLFKSGDDWLSGQPLSFMIKLPEGVTVYHSGDTSLFSDLKLYGDLHKPDVALLCVGGVRARNHEVVPLPPDEAALALEWLGAPVAVPMHYRPDSNAPQEFVEAVKARDLQTQITIMTPGETLDLTDKFTPHPPTPSPTSGLGDDSFKGKERA
jgi:L-ascorbate metabolism protein UlaG (beta-lactamase superfamily)